MQNQPNNSILPQDFSSNYLFTILYVSWFNEDCDLDFRGISSTSGDAVSPNPLHFFCSLVREHLNQWSNFKKTFPRLHSQAAPWHRFQVQRWNQLQLPPRPQVLLRDGLQGLAAHGRVDPPYLQRCQRRKAWPKDLGPEPAAAQGEAQQGSEAATVEGTGGHGDARVWQGCGWGKWLKSGSAMSGDGNGKGELPRWSDPNCESATPFGLPSGSLGHGRRADTSCGHVFVASKYG